MMKKILLVIMLLILATSVQGAFTTQVAGTIGTLTGVSSLSGANLTVSITSTDGVTTYVTGSVASGTYSTGMTLLSSPVSLNYSSNYTYKLTVAGVGNFSYNFTTPITPGTSGYTYGDNSASKVLTTATGAGNVVLPSISDVKTGVTYGSASSLTGTFPSDGTAVEGDVCNSGTFYSASGTKLTGSRTSCSAGGGTLTWSANSYNTTYDCSMYDNLAGTPLSAESSATLCGYDSGCTWTGSACTGTPSGLSTMNWYAGTLACYNSPEDSLPAGTWRLPSAPELYGRMSDEFMALTQPQVFSMYTYYWSSTPLSGYPSAAWTAYVSYSAFGGGNDGKSTGSYPVRCVKI